MGVYPRPKDKIQKEIERKELVDFAASGGTPKGAPMCYGTFFGDKTKRQRRSCNTCDDTLNEMCRQFGQFLRRVVRANELALKDAEPWLLDQYKVLEEGHLTTVDLERKKYRAKD